jgi:hypothetical protein
MAGWGLREGTIQDLLSRGGGRVGVEARTPPCLQRPYRASFPGGWGRERTLRKGIQGMEKGTTTSKEEHTSLLSWNRPGLVSLLSLSLSSLCVAEALPISSSRMEGAGPNFLERIHENVVFFAFSCSVGFKDLFQEPIIFHFFKRKINESNCEKSYFCITT